jgi:hypothetical protein
MPNRRRLARRVGPNIDVALGSYANGGLQPARDRFTSASHSRKQRASSTRRRRPHDETAYNIQAESVVVPEIAANSESECYQRAMRHARSLWLSGRPAGRPRGPHS